MANTRATTLTRSLRTQFGIIYAALAFFALLNLFFTLTPVDRSNNEIDEKLRNAASVPAASRVAFFSQLMAEQERNLSNRPSEPYAWARLAWLRLTNKGTDADAFEALRMSDLVSPFEAPQLPERAVMWRHLKGAENPDQKAYQDNLWAKAYGMRRDETWSLAVQNNLDMEAGEALKRVAPDLYEEWKYRESQKSHG